MQVAMEKNIISRRFERIKHHNKKLSQIKDEYKQHYQIHEDNLNMNEVMNQIKRKSDLRDRMHRETTEFNLKYFAIQNNLNILKNEQAKIMEDV